MTETTGQTTLINHPCVPRKWFLWFKQYRHEPGEELWLGLHNNPMHVVVGRRHDRQGEVEHLVAFVCKWCDRPYFTTYHWSGEISWRAFDEHSPEAANRILQEEFEKFVAERGGRKVTAL